MDKLETSPEFIFDESYLFSSVTDFYSRYTSSLYPSVPINLFGHGYVNLFDDDKVNGFFKDMNLKFKKIQNKYINIRNQYNEFLFILFLI